MITCGRHGRRESHATADRDPRGSCTPDGYCAGGLHVRTWFERERERVFSRLWAFAGLSNEVPEPGDYLCVQAGHHPLVVVRGEDGVLRAFHNLCRHRGVAFLEGRGSAKRGLRCPYHYWMYGLDGRLQGVTSSSANFPDLDREKLGLRPAAVGAFKNAIFVHPDPDPTESLEDHLEDLPDKSWPYEGRNLQQVLRVRHVYRANWKLALENALDTYHLGYLHEAFRGMDTTHTGMEALGRRHHTQTWIQTPEARAAFLANETPTGLSPPIDGVEFEQLRASAYFLFPNHIIGPGTEHFVVSGFTPVDVDLTWFDINIWIDQKVGDRERAIWKKALGVPGLDWHQPDDGGPLTQTISLDDIRGLGISPLKSGAAMKTASVTVEDQWLVERLQLAMASPNFEVGPLAPFGETPISHFHRAMKELMDVA